MKIPDLKVCPFCGGTAYLNPSEDGVSYDVRCIKCGASTDEYRALRDATDAWNRRSGLIIADEITPFTEEQWQKFCSYWNLDVKSIPKWFAATRWAAEDIIAIAEERGVTLTTEQAEAWWARNESWFQNLLVERGNEILSEADFSA